MMEFMLLGVVISHPGPWLGMLGLRKGGIVRGELMAATIGSW